LESAEVKQYSVPLFDHKHKTGLKRHDRDTPISLLAGRLVTKNKITDNKDGKNEKKYGFKTYNTRKTKLLKSFTATSS
jgi:hypothetical protein